MLTLNDGRSELWQWDTGRTLAVDADCSQVHFSNKVLGRSIDVDVIDGSAIIPDVLLQTDKELTAWAFVGTPENGYTKISKVFKVNKRNKPADYVFTPTDQTTLAEIMERIDDLESIQDPDAIKNAVDDYLANNPIKVEETDPTVPEWAKQPNPPDVKIPDKLPNPYSITFTGAVKASYDGSSAVEIKIPDSGGNVDQGSGLSDTAKSLLITILRNAVYSSDQSATITALEKALGSSGGSGSDEPIEPDDPSNPEVTLTGISATYSGGAVNAGTALTDLTGISVIAVYSDGSTETVTDYTLSGEIAEGSNTITVSYGGMTTTFTVTGLVVFGFDDIAIGVTTSFVEGKGMNISRTSDTTSRATLVPIGQYLTKGKTYKFSLGDAASSYYYGAQVFIASEADLTFEITGGQQYFSTVPTRTVDTGWMQTDYEYTATDDNEILTVNFKNSTNGVLAETDREILLVNFTAEEV